MAKKIFKKWEVTAGESNGCFTIQEFTRMTAGDLYINDLSNICDGGATTFFAAFAKFYKFFDYKFENQEDNCISRSQLKNAIKKIKKKC